MNKMSHVDFIVPTPDEDKVLEQLDNRYTKVSEMSPEERAFLNALILRKRPRALLEIGVSAGGSSIVILNAIKDFTEAKLYSIDLMDTWYKDAARRSGFMVDYYPQLKAKWELFTGRLALHFMDRIALSEEGIDFCLIDTAHTNPGEIFDFLMVLPFLNDDAIVVFHDTSLQTHYFLKKKYLLGERAITNNLLMSSVSGRKLLQGNYADANFPNIAGIQVSKETKENIFEIFNLLTIRWHYLPTEKQEQEIISWFEKYYDTYYIAYLKKIFVFQKKVLLNDKRYRLKSTIKMLKVSGKKKLSSIKKIIGKA